jgi:predicted nucleotidyltransferase component of viral defense system
VSTTAEALTTNYVEDHNFVKLAFPEGEIDFVASAPLTAYPANIEMLFGRAVQVETSTEILAKKLWHRGSQFTARDIFDFALIAEREPQALQPINPILQDRREVVLSRIAQYNATLRESFESLTVLNYRRSFDECVAIVRGALSS